MPNPATTGIADVVTAAGSQEAVAAYCGVSQVAVSKWVRQGYAPRKRVVELEAEYGVPRDRLCDPRLKELVSL